MAIIKAAISGNRKFFLGTDTAPHLKKDKESACGCAGVFNAPYCISIIAEIFDQNNSLNNLENFTSLNGAKHYELKPNNEKIKLHKRKFPLNFEEKIIIGTESIIIFKPDFPVFWEVV